jgi:predicted ATP-binding protein involved in virulence
MRLTKAIIENYKSCRNTTLECGTNLTALVGLNAAGKTNILSAISLCHNDIAGRRDINAKLTIQLSDASIPELSPLVITFEKVRGEYTTQYNIKQYQDESLGFLLSTCYYSAAAFSNTPEVTDVVDLRNGAGDLPARDKFLYDLVWAKRTNTELFSRYVSLVGPEEIGLIDEIIIQDITETSVIPLVKVNGKKLLFKQLSEGTFRTMALLFYLIGNDGGLILIEEPENSVHPSLLRDIVEIMHSESEHKQIIFSTHSDLVLSMLKPENIVFVDNGPDGTKTRSLSAELAHGNYKGLKSYLENEGDLGSYWKAGGFDD